MDESTQGIPEKNASKTVIGKPSYNEAFKKQSDCFIKEKMVDGEQTPRYSNGFLPNSEETSS